MTIESTKKTIPSIASRYSAFVFAAVFPAGCFLICNNHPPILNAYQSGNLDIYAGLLLAWPSNAPMLPLVGLAMLAMTAWLVRPSLSALLIVRLGVYSGLVLSAQYIVLLIFVGGFFRLVLPMFLAAPFLFAAVYIPAYFASKTKRFTIKHVMMLTTFVAVLLAILAAFDLGLSFLQSSGHLLFIACLADPVLAVITYGMVSRLIWNESHSSPAKTRYLACIAWLATWTVMWRSSIVLMLEEYAKLPTNPACYVCGVAAQGHRWITRAKRTSDGRHWVSPQLRQIKFLELSLMAAFPRLHAILRSGYDVAGPPIAKTLSGSQSIATLGHLALMPLQLVGVLLARALRIPQDSIDRIYK